MSVSNIVSLLDGAIYNGVGLYFVVVGIIVSIRFTGYPDLTVDGSFTVGAAFYSLVIKSGSNIGFALLVAMFVGSLAGMLTSFVNQHLKIGKIISSIIVTIILILIVPYFTHGVTISLLRAESFFSKFNTIDFNITQSLFPGAAFSLHLLFNTFVILIALVATLFLWWFTSNTKIGIQLRYIGAAKNPGLITRKYRKYYIYLGLGLGNLFVAMGGAIEAEKRAGFNQNMGFGILLIALAILLLGESMIKARKKRDYLYVKEYLMAAAIGAIVYSFGVQLLLASNIAFLDVRLSSTLFLL